jgi:hypothetical protein
MTVISTFSDRLSSQLIPTATQVFGTVALSVLIIGASQSRQILTALNITNGSIDGLSKQLHSHLDVILRSAIVSHFALIVFWAIVGLIAYLICWGVYNVFVEARNEVTLSTDYTNQGHWKGAQQTLAIKAVSAVCLVVVLGTLTTGVSLWLAVSALAIAHVSMWSIGEVLTAILGLAMQLYIIILFVQLTFTPWYRPEVFTGS